jgi:hypothetical protein
VEIISYLYVALIMFRSHVEIKQRFIRDRYAAFIYEVLFCADTSGTHSLAWHCQCKERSDLLLLKCIVYTPCLTQILRTVGTTRAITFAKMQALLTYLFLSAFFKLPFLKSVAVRCCVNSSLLPDLLVCIKLDVGLLPTAQAQFISARSYKRCVVS